MKTEQREETRVVTTTVYIADDGTEFIAERECRRHETLQKRLSLLDKLKDIEHAASNCPPTDGYEFCENYYFDWYKPKTKEEIDVLNEVYDEIDLKEDCLNKWICIEHENEVEDDCYSSNYTSTLDDSMNYVERLLSKLGYDIEFKERK